MKRSELRSMPVEQLMAEVAKRVRRPEGLERVGRSYVPNTERCFSNGLVWITGKTYYSETNDSAKVFPWLRHHI